MSRSIRLFIFLLRVGLSRCDGVQYIAGIPEYKSLRDCGKWCYNNAPGDPVGNLGCKQSNTDSCFCRLDLQSQAESSLSYCVKSTCSNEVDVTMALHAYSVYCTDRGFTPTAKDSTASRQVTMNGMPTSGRIPGVTVTATATIEVTNFPLPSSNGNPRSDSGGLSRSDSIALGTGLGIPLLGIIITILIWRHPRRMRDGGHRIVGVP
ncbi:hypothetical protein GQ44DRAFT_798273 [Phaeosphaeriaceae sp. PMI808]|nr:hypothetical protein GQ44DRAFT_798273 [Phaeosphaeriaceae sp. PMI808]